MNKRIASLPIRLGLTVCTLVLIGRVALAADYEFYVSGTVDYQFKTDADYRSLKKVTVEVWDEDIGADQLMSTAYTDNSGYYDVQISSDDSGGPDVYVKVVLESQFDTVEVEESGDPVYLESTTHDDQTTAITIDVRFDSASGENDEAHLYQVVQNAISGTDFGTESMDQVHATRTGAGDDESFFETTDLAEIHVGINHVWYANNDSAYGDWTVCHEVGHAIMWAMRGHNWPALGAAPAPHFMDQEAGRGFAWVEGWAHIYASAKDGVAESTSNWNFDDPNSCERRGTPYWAGGVNSDGTGENPVTGADNSGLGVEGAISSAGYLIGFATVWPVVRDNGDTIDSFEDVWDHLSKTQAQREAVEKNNMIFSRGRLTEFRYHNSPWYNFADGLAMPLNSVLAFRAQENDEASLNLETGEGDTVTGMRFSYRTVVYLNIHTQWYPYNSTWTEIGTATSKVGDNWEVTDWTPPAAGDYWIRAQTLHGSGAETTQDTILPGDLGGYPYSGMRAWTRDTLHAILHLKVNPATAGDPAFVQPDRRNPAALARARAARARRLQELHRQHELARMLRALAARIE